MIFLFFRDINIIKYRHASFGIGVFLFPILVMLFRRLTYRVNVAFDGQGFKLFERYGVLLWKKRVFSTYTLKKHINHSPVSRPSRYLICESRGDSVKFGGMLSEKFLDQILESYRQINERNQ